jgi:low temperature requirement protein LtrA
VPGRTLDRFKRWFWRPPRPHGQTIVGRRVSALELLYDLVYVAVISQAAHHLAEHVSPRALVEFAVVFALIWIAWVNGSAYLELHGREDGRTRSIVFVQMGILALLAVFTADAADDTGPAFALVYATLLAVLTGLSYTVWREDRQHRPELLAVMGRYVSGMGMSVALILASAFLPREPRLIVWAGFAVAWIVGMLLAGRAPVGLYRGLSPTDSLIERFGLFTIIVLGEVVLGVVDGLSAAERDLATIATGMLALGLGFGFWWIYFDVVGGRLPRDDGPALAGWMVSHFPITLAFAGGGAATVSLIGHAHDGSTPEATAWGLAGAVALGLVAVVVAARALVDAGRLAGVYRPLTRAMCAGAGAAAVVGWARPAPWLLALLLGAILSALWIFAVGRFLRAGAWAEGTTDPPGGVETAIRDTGAEIAPSG